jgi:hypothetical protein
MIVMTRLPSSIGKTSEGGDIFGFSVLDGIPHRIWIGKPEDPDCRFVTVLANGSPAIEDEDASGETTKCDYFGDFNIVEWAQVERFGLTSEPVAVQLLDLFQRSAYQESDSIHWDNVTKGYYAADELPQHLFWSDYAAWVAGPGYEEGRMEGAIESPEEELWPLFDLAGIESMTKLRECLDKKLPRWLDAYCPLIYSPAYSEHSFGRWGHPHYLDWRDAIKWMQALAGKSVDAIRQAELDTIEQIDLWLKSKGAS